MHHSAVHSATFAFWLRRHKLLGYFTLAFGISWVGILIVLVTTGFKLAALPPWETGVGVG